MQKTEYKTYQMKNKSGIEIENILFTYEHNLVNISQKINFYCKFIEYFIKLHLKYLDRLLSSLKNIKSQIENDFELDETMFMKTEKTESSEIDNDYESDSVSVGDESYEVELYTNKSPVKQNSFQTKIKEEEVNQTSVNQPLIKEEEVTQTSVNQPLIKEEEVIQKSVNQPLIKEEIKVENLEDIKDNLSVKSSFSNKSNKNNKSKILKLNQ